MSYTNYFRIIFLIISFFYCSIITAQPQKIKFGQIGLEQGLSQSTVNTIVQDAQGFIWFGTQDGLNRYDGYSVKVFRHDPSDSTSITGNSILALLNDHKGNLWVGTTSTGLDKYVISENKFYHYKFNKNETGTISDNHVTSIFEDSYGNIWVGTNAGLNLFDREKETFQRFLFNAKNQGSISSNTIRAICEDHSGNLWVATSKGLSKLKLYKDRNKLNNSGFIRYNPASLNRNTLSDVSAVYVDHDGVLWIGVSGSGFYRFAANATSFRSGAGNPIAGKLIRSIFEDSKRNLWISSFDAGLSRFDRDSGKLLNFTDDPMMTVYEDKSGIIWCGSFYTGVKIYDQQKSRFRSFYKESTSNNGNKKDNIVLAILEDDEGELWEGTYGNGLNRYSRDRKKVTTYKFNPKNLYSIGSNNIFAICQSSDGNIWVGTDREGLNRFNKKDGIFTRYKKIFQNQESIGYNEISVLYEDVNGNLWIGCNNGNIALLQLKASKLVHINSNKNKPDNPYGFSIGAICEDKEGGVWIGTIQDGLYRYQQSLDKNGVISGTFKKYLVLPAINLKDRTGPGINNNSIFSIYEDKEGIIWLGTDGGGLNRYDPSSGVFSYYTTKQGLPNNVVYGILPDNAGNLWLSTNKGLSRFNKATKKFKNFDLDDGLPSNEFNQGAYFAGKNGELFFGGMGGLTTFFPGDIGDNNFVPPVYLTSFKVFDKTLKLPVSITSVKEIKLSYSQNFFSFEFVALNYTSPGKNQYAYKLEGFDNGWHYVSSANRYASYTNLDPGEYILRIKGSNNDGVWNEAGVSVPLIITPPFWMTWWFRTVAIVVLLYTAWFFYKRRIEGLKREKALQQEISRRLIEKQEEERRRIALEMHDSLGQDLLLIKNRANTAAKKEIDGKAATDNFSQISLFASRLLNNVRQISHNLRPPELDQLGLSETLRSILLAAREATTITMDGEVENIDGLVPQELEINFVRILQEALSNIIKHAEATECEIIVVVQDSYINITINDNGKGIKKEGSNRYGLGLTGISERVRILGGSYKIESAAEKGTRIFIQVPVSNTTKNNL